MTTPHDSHLAPPGMTDAVSALLGGPAAVTQWTAAPCGHVAGDHDGPPPVQLITGEAALSDGTRSFSLVVKSIPAAQTTDVTAPAWAPREACAYASGLLAQLSPGLRAPRCYGVAAAPAGGDLLWLEYVQDDGVTTWPAARYAQAASAVGRFSGGSLQARHPAWHAYPWLSRSPLPGALREFAPLVATLSGARDDAAVAAAFSDAHATCLIDLLSEIPTWCSTLDTLPQTLCHWDVHRANLVVTPTVDGGHGMVLLDWAGVGWGPVGADLSHLLSQTVHFFGMDPGELQALDATLFDAYLDGARAAGWHGDPRHVRFAYAAASAVRLIVRAGTALRVASHPASREAFARAAHRPFPELAARFARVLPHYLAVADEARALARTL